MYFKLVSNLDQDNVLQQYLTNGIVEWGKEVRRILQDGEDLSVTVKKGNKTPMVTALIEGAVGAGKSALAAQITLKAQFPCVRLINPSTLIHHGEGKEFELHMYICITGLSDGICQVFRKSFPKSRDCWDLFPKKLKEKTRDFPNYSPFKIVTLQICNEENPK